MSDTVDTAVIPPYLEALNPEQRRAVFHTGRPLLILAGAGSGKTRVITTKIAWLIREKGVDPRSILAVTFTNKAAREMAERARRIDERAAGAMLRTFHSFGAWFLRRNGSLAGLDSGFVIYDDDDVISLLGSIIEKTEKAEIKKIAHNISKAKDYFLSPDSPELARIDSRRKFRDLYRQYEERLARTGNVDFGDLIKKPVEILRGNPEVARRFRERFSVIMVDEYQDANIAQFELLKELTGPDTYVCVVGDDDQSIYRFRGAEVKNILEFPTRFSGTEIIRLVRNYRSTDPILRAASSVVDNNKGRLGKTLSAEKGNGKLPVLAFLPDQDNEVSYCASLISNSVKNTGAQWSDWAILYRTNAQSHGFETTFPYLGIPYRVVGSLKFYEREEIKDGLALLALLVNPRDEVAFRRVVNKPVRGVGAASIDRIIGVFESQNCDLEAAAHTVELSVKAHTGISAFFAIMEKARALLETPEAENVGSTGDTGKKSSKKRKSAELSEGLRAGDGLSVCVVQLLGASGLAAYHKSEDEVAGTQRLNNMQELANAASLYPLSREGLLEFLEHIELDRSQEERSNAAGADSDIDNRVTLITFHNTKGLEFRRVIMTGLEQGIFPREDKKDEELEEERRLFYVGATRAMDELYLCSCAVRRMYGRIMPMEPSLFLRELDKKNVRVIGKAPLSFGSGNASHGGLAGNAARGSRAAADPGAVELKAGWRRGERVFHDDHGYGAVTDVRDSDDGPIVKVMFETGRELMFLSEYQGKAFVKIGNDN